METEFISLSMAGALTGLSKRTLWRRIAEGTVRTDKQVGRRPSEAGIQTGVVLDDVLALSPLPIEQEDRALILEADAGRPDAQCDLGLLLIAQGLPDAAVPLLKASAEQHCLEGMHWLGRCLIAGRGVPEDVQRGIDWIARAANHGHATARHMMQYIYDPERPTQPGAELDNALDLIEREIILRAMEESTQV